MPAARVSANVNVMLSRVQLEARAGAESEVAELADANGLLEAAMAEHPTIAGKEDERVKVAKGQVNEAWEKFEEAMDANKCPREAFLARPRAGSAAPTAGRERRAAPRTTRRSGRATARTKEGGAREGRAPRSGGVPQSPGRAGRGGAKNPPGQERAGRDQRRTRDRDSEKDAEPLKDGRHGSSRRKRRWKRWRRSWR